MQEPNNIFVGIAGLVDLFIENPAVQKFYKDYCLKSGSLAELWLTRGPRGVLTVEVADLVVRVMCCDGNATNQEAHLFRRALSSLNTDPYFFFNQRFDDLRIARELSQIYRMNSLSAPYEKPDLLIAVEAHDAVNRTDFSSQVRNFLIAIARGAAEVNAVPSEKKKEVLRLIEAALQPTIEPWGLVGFELGNFVKTVPVSAPDGNQKPHKLETLLESDILALVVSFTHADRQVSDKRVKMTFAICKYVRGDTAGAALAVLDKIDDESSLVLRNRKPQVDKELATLKVDIEKQWNTIGLGEPSALALLQSYDQAFGTKYAEPAKNLLRRLAFQLLNADGPPSRESQQLFGEYNSLLENAVSTSNQARQRHPSIPDRTSDQIDEPTHIKMEEYKSLPGTTSSTALSATPISASDTTPDLETLLRELNTLIGLGQVKQDVSELANYIRVQKLRREKGLKAPEISLHMVFHGNPGTGKTTVARLLSKIYKALGVVRKGHLVETDRSDLVAGYVGQTALKVKAVAEKSLGGILFIDEAYALKRSDDSQDYGNEAIETLLKFMEDNRQDLVVIVAGYPVEMRRFLDANPGLQSRFNKSLTFPDYLPEELMQIFLRLCSESDYKLSEAAQGRLSTYFQAAYQNRDLKFGNARLVRNIFEKAVTNVANRVVQNQQVDNLVLELIEDSDVTAAIPCGSPK